MTAHTHARTAPPRRFPRPVQALSPGGEWSRFVAAGQRVLAEQRELLEAIRDLSEKLDRASRETAESTRRFEQAFRRIHGEPLPPSRSSTEAG